MTQGYKYHKLRKTFGKFFRSYSELLSKFGAISFSRNHSPSLLRWSCLQTKEGQRRSEFHLVGLESNETPSTSSVWPSAHREDYRSCAWPFLQPCADHSLKRCILTTSNKAVGTLWRALSNPLRGNRVRIPVPLIVSRDSFSLSTWARAQTARSTAYLNGCPYIFFDILLFYYICLCTTFLLPLRFGWLLVLSPLKGWLFTFFKCVSFWLHGCCG